MSTPSGTLLICINRRFRLDEPSCAARGSLELARRLEDGVRARRLNVEIERSICMGHCQTGPTVRLVPGGKFFHGRGPDDAPAMLDELESLYGVRANSDDGGPPLAPFGS